MTSSSSPSSSLSIGVIGAGSFGTALAFQAAIQPERRVVLWGRNEALLQAIQSTRENTPYLPGARLPDNITATSDLGALAECDLLLVAPPSKVFREVAGRIRDAGLPGIAVSCTKGIERGSGLRMSQILEELLPDRPAAVLSGPSHAEEIVKGMPAALVVGSTDPDVTARLQQALTSPAFRLYSSRDVAGIELGGALKNIIAIAAGVSDGLGFGDNTKAALITRATVEMVRLGTLLGGQRDTFYGLSGMGDLMVTCFSRHSRNRAVGERIGRGESPAEIADSMQMVAEGVPTTRSVYERARELGVETPIVDAMHGLLYEGKAPRDVVAEVLSREPKPEEW